ncbi:uncharacterized protein LOC126412973 [Schistocerca serialis cubense]|uniref:uncharacterized protein LOC126412973 n=1 Tax=Schistocerca serialis cubense TaxID=2023355 RepID=UPI00214EADD1|nr:uncharacterized protein LOC126412973 [Schistocerca serialis cubense]
MQVMQTLSMSTRACVVTLLLGQCYLPLRPVAAAPSAAAAIDEQWLCAPGCWCSRDGLSTECLGVTPQPSALPAGLLALSVRAHQLRELRNDTFAALPMLQQLDLSDGRISEVAEDALSTLPRLRSLSLSNNELTFLLPNSIAANAALEALDLSSNPLVLPSIGPFLRSSSLRELNLAVCSLRRFTPDSFTQLPSLRSLDISFNSFSQLSLEDVQPFANLSWLSVDADALSEDALAFLQANGVEVDVFELMNSTGDITPPEQQDDGGGARYLALLDKDYPYDDDGIGEDYAVLKNVDVAYDSDSQTQWVADQLQTGASQVEVPPRWVGHPSWKLVLYSVVLGCTACLTAALAYWATVLVVRRRSATKAAQGPRDTLDRAFRHVASLPAYQQLQRQPAKAPSGSGQGYRRLYDEDESPASLPPRAAQPERCTCLSCSEPVPTQPCICFYERPAPVHGTVPSQYYTLYATHIQ